MISVIIDNASVVISHNWWIMIDYIDHNKSWFTYDKTLLIINDP